MHTECILNTHIKMTGKTISARMELDDYTNRVLGVIKIKFGLKDKSEALNKFIELYGDEVIEKEATEEYTKKLIELTKKHYQKYSTKKMTLQELDALCEV